MAPARAPVALLLAVSCLLAAPMRCVGIRLFFLGDSLMDTGNSKYNEGPGQVATCNWAPYGMSMTPPGPTGRCTNGKTVPDLLAEALGFTTPPPALEPGATFTNGANLATCGAATTGDNERKSNFTGEVQVEMLRTILWGTDPVGGVVADAIAVVEFGAVDLTNFYRTTSPAQWATAFPGFVKALALAQAAMVQSIYDLGVRNFVVANLGPAGCIPLVRSEARSLFGRCFGPVNAVASLFNRQLESAMVQLQKKLTDARIVFFDTYAIAYRAARLTGLSISGPPCCGTGKVQCGTGGTGVCSDPSKRFYWDNWHPTEVPMRKFFDLAWAGNTDVMRPMNASTLTMLVETGAPITK